MRIISTMNQSPADVAELPERGVQWVKDRVGAVLEETEGYVRTKPAQSLVWAFVAGFVLNRLPFVRILTGMVRLLLFALRPAILVYGATKLYQASQQESP